MVGYDYDENVFASIFFFSLFFLIQILCTQLNAIPKRLTALHCFCLRVTGALVMDECVRLY